VNCCGWEQIEELEGSNSRLAEEVQTLKTEIESKETSEEALQERISELDSEISMSVILHQVLHIQSHVVDFSVTFRDLNAVKFEKLTNNNQQLILSYELFCRIVTTGSCQSRCQSPVDFSVHFVYLFTLL